MQRKIILLLIIASCTASLDAALNAANSAVEYIVYMGAKGNVASVASHHEMLTSVLGSEQRAAESIIFTYKHGFSGFSARLSEQHADAISRMPNVVSVFPNRIVQLHTTRSWDFLGLVQEKEDMKETKYAGPDGAYDTILGMLDTGLWPESESFSDAGFGPVPVRWKAFCNNTGIKNSSDLFPCTKKLIGARAYPFSGNGSSPLFQSPVHSSFAGKLQLLQQGKDDIRVEDFDNARDVNGHGTHTSSTAAGVEVEGASLLGVAAGTARGGYPKARLAMYKVCWNQGICSNDAILAAIDDAIHDGVDALSLSAGGKPADYDKDGIAIGAYHAVEHGIVMSCSAGNSGRDYISNAASWIITVGASTIDRSFASSVRLGNNVILPASGGLNADEPAKPSHSIVYAGDIPSSTSSSLEASRCLNGSLDTTKRVGKIVVCILDSQLRVSELHGAAGLIIIADGFQENLFSLPLRFAIVEEAVGDKLLQYIKNTKEPTASILKTETLSGVKPAPQVARFSSRGPNPVGLDIIKPDVTAPGVNILAAWSGARPVSGPDNTSLIVKFNIISGTSMSCPHVSGAVSRLKSLHPEWSPAAIRSALMTTASFEDNTGQPMKDNYGNTATPFDYGSGEIHPAKAADPGLVYDISPGDYAVYLCQTGYSSSRVGLITGDKAFSCPEEKIDLNYPSFTFLNLTDWSSQKASRTLKNVGAPNSSYSVKVSAPQELSIEVTPAKLSFSYAGESLGFSVSVKAKAKGSLLPGTWVFGSVAWTDEDGSHVVRSPIAVLTM